MKKAGCEAKFWLSPVQLVWNYGLSDHELWDIVRILENNQIMLMDAWNNAD